MKTIGIILLALVPSAVWADAPASVEPETIVVIDHAPDRDASPEARDRERALGDAPFVTIIHPDEHPATASVADAVGATVGAQTRSLGGFGAYESITVRGAAPGHTIILIDGVPLARIAAVTTDLGRFALDSFGEVELYRGAVPVELGGAGVGGALNLVTRLGRGDHGERVQASFGGGSFGARHLRAHYGDSHADGKLLSSTTIGYQGATGDYTYFYDNGTPLNPNDDAFAKRKNNGFDQLDLSSRVGAADRTATGGVRIAYKDQGLPGSASQPSTAASLGTADVIADARGDVRVGPAIARELGFVLVERQHLRDPLGELGLGAQARDYLTISGGASSTWLAALGRHRATAGLELRGDRFRDSDAGALRPALVGDRVGGALLAAVDLALDPDAQLVVTPAFRIDALRTAPTPMTVGPDALVPIAARSDVVPSPRLSARALLGPDVSIKASAGWYVRLPTLIELFGDRGTILGSPELRPERGPSADAGFVVAPSHAVRIPNGDLPDLVIDRIFVEAAGFATRAHDTITLVPSAGYVVHAMNVADALTYGGELVASARFARTVSITANYTRLVTAQLVPDLAFANKPLPRQPGHAVYARADVVRKAFGRRGEVWFDTSWQSDTFLDQASLQRIPARLLLGTGFRVELGGELGLSLAVANLADLRVEQVALVPAPRPDLTHATTPLADVAGFPLPGRSFYLSLDWSH
jgi:iron complex outermembrane receptor protein